MSYRIQKDMAKMVSQKRVLVLLFVFGFVLLAVAALAYLYYLQQWMEIRDLYYVHFRDTSYLLMVLGVACIIASGALFTRIPSDSSSQDVFVVKKCPYCGETLMEDMKFCPYCGETLKEMKENKMRRKKSEKKS